LVLFEKAESMMQPDFIAEGIQNHFRLNKRNHTPLFEASAFLVAVCCHRVIAAATLPVSASACVGSRGAERQQDLLSFDASKFCFFVSILSWQTV
jgi:hypothetical protein